MVIVAISPIAWDNSDGAHRPVQFARELARRGHSVTYVEIEKSRAPVPGANPRILNFEQLGWDELNLVRAWYGMDYIPPADAVAHAETLPANLQEPGIVICSAPFRPALALLPPLAARGYAIVYDVLDDISEMRALGTFCYDELAENYLAQNADLIVALSPRLREKFAAHANKKLVLIRDGVDLTPFRAIDRSGLSQLARGEITLGFWGTMWDYNLDVPLLQTLTRARPQWHWHFIGAYDLDPTRPSLATTLAAPNVHFHSSVPRAALGQYAQSFDVCVMPTPVTPFNLARDPLKVYEYLACYKPVVATNLEQLADMPYLYLSRDADEFLANVERAAQTAINCSELDAYLQQQTWAKRTDALLAAVSALKAAPRPLPPPPHGAMPNAGQEPDRWQAFAQHLERMVADREAHIQSLHEALEQSSMRKRLKQLVPGKQGNREEGNKETGK